MRESGDGERTPRSSGEVTLLADLGLLCSHTEALEVTFGKPDTSAHQGLLRDTNLHQLRDTHGGRDGQGEGAHRRAEKQKECNR